MNYQLLINEAKASGLDAIEIYEQNVERLSIRVFNKEVEKNEWSHTKGLSIRASYQGKMSTISVENTNDDQIPFIIERLKENAELIDRKEPSTIFSGSEHYVELPKPNRTLQSVDPKVKIDVLLQLEKELLSLDERVETVDHCSYQEQWTSIRIHNSEGLQLEKSTGQGVIVASVVAKENGDVKNHYEYLVIDDLNDLELKPFAETIVNKAVSKLHAAPVPSNQYPVIFEAKTFANFLLAFSSLFSGEAAIKGMTLLKEKLGEQIADANIQLINDPLFTEAMTQSAFDDEGVASKRTEVIKDGVLKTLLHNLSTAQILGTTSTGNGYKPNLEEGITVRPYNLYLEPGQVSFEEMLSTVEEGLYITALQGLHSGVNPITGDFSLQSSGYLIKNGTIDRPVTLIVVSGNFFELLHQVELIGDDLTFTLSRVGSPSIKITQLSVSGQ